MRRAARTDANHREIVAALRKAGASVADLSAVGGGVPDLLVGFRSRNWCLEVKDGKKPPSARKLTPEQQAWVDDWRGQWACVKSAEEAVEMVTRGACGGA